MITSISFYIGVLISQILISERTKDLEVFRKFSIINSTEQTLHGKRWLMPTLTKHLFFFTQRSSQMS